MQKPEKEKTGHIGFLLVIISVSVLFLFGCCAVLGTNPNSAEINNQDVLVSGAFQKATALLDFQDKSQLVSFAPTYATYSATMGNACDTLNKLDKDGQLTSNRTQLICQNKKGLDACFFYLEKIKTQVHTSDNPDINIDNADVLCSDLRSLGLDTKLNTEETKYKAYMIWLKAEPDIDKQWQNVQYQMQNSSNGQIASGSISDYYNNVKASMASAGTSLNQIKLDCASESDFNASAIAGQVCSKIDTYISDMGTAQKSMQDIFTFTSKFQTGTITADESLVSECRAASQKESDLSNLQLFKDNTGGSSSNFSTTCDGIEQLVQASNSLGFAIVFQNGKLSDSTKINLMKAKTVYIQTDTVLASGVLIAQDDNGYYILTNAHAVLTIDPATGASYLPNTVRVQFYDGHVGYATKLRTNKENYDMAILYVPLSDHKYPTATFSESEYPPVGSHVVAIGNPYGLEFSVSEGTISAFRDMGCLTNYCYGKVLQTDTAINPGNSGGGLWDYDSGYLVGINSLGLTQAVGLNFAISMIQYGSIKDTFVEYNLG